MKLKQFITVGAAIQNPSLKFPWVYRTSVRILWIFVLKALFLQKFYFFVKHGKPFLWHLMTAWHFISKETASFWCNSYHPTVINWYYLGSTVIAIFLERMWGWKIGNLKGTIIKLVWRTGHSLGDKTTDNLLRTGPDFSQFSGDSQEYLVPKHFWVFFNTQALSLLFSIPGVSSHLFSLYYKENAFKDNKILNTFTLNSNPVCRENKKWK